MENNSNGILNKLLNRGYKGKTDKMSRIQIIAVVAVSIIVLLTPQFLSSYRLNLIITILTSAYFAQCWNLMSGFTGQFSFGHAAFFGIGAYTSSILAVDFGVNPWIGMIVGMILAGVVSSIIGYLSFHYNLRGDYFALATMAFCEILRVIVKNTKALHASTGVTIKYSKDWTQMQFGGKEGYLYIAFIMLALITLGLYLIRRTKMGLYFVAIRENEDAAKALGINAFQYKMIALIASAMLSAIAGTFYAQYYLYIDPTICFANTVSVSAITPCIIGGTGTIFGPIIGAAIIEPISEITNALLAQYVGLNMVVYGMILVLAILLMPNGVVGLWNKIKGKKITKVKKIVVKGESEHECVAKG